MLAHPEVTIELYEVIIAAFVNVKIPLPTMAPDKSELEAATC